MPSNIGRHFIVGFEGTSLTKKTKSQLLEIKPAGVILYDTNIESRDQVRALINDLKSLLGDEMIVSVDQEGGKVERLRKVSTSLPSLWALGKAANRDKQLLIEHSSILASELADLGFNLVYAPCADLCTNSHNPIIGTRSLGSDSELVSEQVRIITDTYQKHGLMACAKHFPGHGDASIDSHLDLCSIEYNEHEYEKHLKPFKAAIEAGVDSVMVAHVAFPKLDDSKLPASMSEKLIQDELRTKLNYSGLVISDEMTMKGISNLGSFAETSMKALSAGCDLLIWNTNLEEPLDAIRDCSEDFDKFLDLKLREPVKSKIDFEANQAKMIKLASAAIDWHKSPEDIKAKLGEVNPESTVILAFDHPKLEKDLYRELSGLDVYSIEDSDLTTKIEGKQNLIILSFQAVNNPKQQVIINKLRAQGSYNILQCSCDLPDQGAELDLYGANKAHFKALWQELT